MSNFLHAPWLKIKTIELVSAKEKEHKKRERGKKLRKLTLNED